MLSVDVNSTITATVQERILTVHNAQGMFHQLEDLVGEHNKDLILNLVNVASCDSSTIALLVELQTNLKDMGRELRLANVAPFVLKVLEMLHITRYFTIE